jgi:hypothetical protein
MRKHKCEETRFQIIYQEKGAPAGKRDHESRIVGPLVEEEAVKIPANVRHL